ncbi:protein of unknown function, DUF928 [Moorena producens 3L]|uniref:DUF928 domain-containing protein n=2 Tax=Coleofasciculaceae TaxID=1892251 RepID=F4XLL1_9CYAN|nr:protein of unknown function, DUF928 [Moorena producens 3L]
MLTKLFRLQYLFPFNLMVVGWISCFLVSRVEADQSINVGQAQQGPIEYTKPKPPDKGTPDAAQGTGTRGPCLYKAELPTLTSLVGFYQPNLDYSYLKVTHDYPTFWIYLPYTSEDGDYNSEDEASLEFSLQDKYGKKDIYRTSFKLLDKPGIVGIRLPEKVNSLEVGQTYRWNIEINCPAWELSNKPTTVYFKGRVKRVAHSPDLEQDLNEAKTLQERIAAYDKHDIWFDQLTELAELRRQQPHDRTLKEAWTEVLTPRLGKTISEQPLLGNLEEITPVLVKK